MSIFHTFGKIYKEIANEDDFNCSDFSGVEDLLGVSWNQCLIASNDDEETLSELYYFIEGNSEQENIIGNFTLCKIDEKEVVLYDDYTRLAIIIKAKDKEDFENFI